METDTLKKSEKYVNETTSLESNSKQLVEQTKIEGTPFTAIRIDEKYFLTLGKYRLTNQLTSLEECKLEAQDASWDRIMQVIQIMIEENNKKTTTNN